MTRGILNAALVHPREVFRLAIHANACAVILVHNHPSGDPTPSADDRAITAQLVAAGRLLTAQHQGLFGVIQPTLLPPRDLLPILGRLRAWQRAPLAVAMVAPHL